MVRTGSKEFCHGNKNHQASFDPAQKNVREPKTAEERAAEEALEGAEAQPIAA